MKEQKPEKTGVEQAKRDELGRFPPGVSGNPAGKPKGTKHLTTLLFEALQKQVPNKDKTYQDLLIERILNDAIIKGKGDIMKLAWNYIDGMPQQGVDITTNGENIKDPSADVQEIARRVSAELKKKKTG